MSKLLACALRFEEIIALGVILPLSQIASETILKALKSQIFLGGLGGHPQTLRQHSIQPPPKLKILDR